jgi:hypothetical protein
VILMKDGNKFNLLGKAAGTTLEEIWKVIISDLRGMGDRNLIIGMIVNAIEHQFFVHGDDCYAEGIEYNQT